jgi:hypothetical protein
MSTVTAPKGPMRTADEVAELHFGGKVDARWVLKHVRPRLQLSRAKVLFYDDDVRAWIAARAEEAAA